MLDRLVKLVNQEFVVLYQLLFLLLRDLIIIQVLCDNIIGAVDGKLLVGCPMYPVSRTEAKVKLESFVVK